MMIHMSREEYAQNRTELVPWIRFPPDQGLTGFSAGDAVPVQRYPRVFVKIASRPLGETSFPLRKPDEMDIACVDPEAGCLAENKYGINAINCIGQEHDAAG